MNEISLFFKWKLIIFDSWVIFKSDSMVNKCYIILLVYIRGFIAYQLFITRNFERNWVFVTNSTFLSSISLQAAQCRRPLIFQTINSVRPNNLSLRYLRFTSSDCKDIGIRQFECVTKTQFLLSNMERIFKISYGLNDAFVGVPYNPHKKIKVCHFLHSPWPL